MTVETVEMHNMYNYSMLHKKCVSACLFSLIFIVSLKQMLSTLISLCQMIEQHYCPVLMWPVYGLD